MIETTKLNKNPFDNIFTFLLEVQISADGAFFGSSCGICVSSIIQRAAS